MKNLLSTFFASFVIFFSFAALAADKSTAPTQTAEEKLARALEESIAVALAQRLERNPAEFRVEIGSLRTQPALEVAIDAGTRYQWMGTAISNPSRLDGILSAPLLIRRGTEQQEIHVHALVRITGPAVVANRNLRRGDAISESDIEEVTMPWRYLAPGAAGTQMANYIGLGVRGVVLAGSALSLDRVDEPLDVRSGDTVDITIHSGPGVLIRSRAVARQQGRRGDRIRLTQPETRKVIQGQVTGPKMVEVYL